MSANLRRSRTTKTGTTKKSKCLKRAWTEIKSRSKTVRTQRKISPPELGYTAVSGPTPSYHTTTSMTPPWSTTDKTATVSTKSSASSSHKNSSSTKSPPDTSKTSCKAKTPPSSPTVKPAQAKPTPCSETSKTKTSSELSQEPCNLFSYFREEIFNKNKKGDMISCSMLEIYNEKMMDLFVFPQFNSSEPQ